MRVTASVKRQTKAALVREGARLFAEQGFAATTMDQVTAAAGVAKGTLYNYFPTKEDLAMAVVASRQAESVDEGMAMAEGSGTAEERLSALLTGATGWIQANPELTMVWCVERIRRGRPDGPSKFNQALTRAVEVGQARGEMRRDRHAVVMAAEIEGLLLVYIVMWYHSGLKMDLRVLLQEGVRGYLQGAGTGNGQGG
ncbi:MAG TPA: TetR/AcrR family transcriptional regulator [Symbiobacteriaceae bacterium]|jgi:AcrR family transcriptional regulator|nr:TetR/AcrR family transcriptional regulator [Symbiobacteriaceae bacterium]